MSVNLTNQGEFQRQAFAQDGFRFLDSTFIQPAGETYVCIYILSAATNVTTTSNVGDALGGVDLLAGMIIYGDLKTVSVGTGTMLAYIA